MRIGILTFHKAINHGAFLQAFSLSNRIQTYFPQDTVEIIDYVAPKERRRVPYVILWNIKHYGIKGGLDEINKVLRFRSAQKKLHCSSRKLRTGDLKKLYAFIDESYDCLIIGSDAVFNWKQTDFPTAYIPDYPFSIPVYTYAASVHGLRFYDEPAKRIEACRRAFERMQYIGVRDHCTELFVHYCAPNIPTAHCCDPTLFIDKEELAKLGTNTAEKIRKKYGVSLETKYIVVMAPDSELVRKIALRWGDEYTILSVYVKSAYASAYLADLDPFEWAAVLKGAAAVVTSYFHGTLLSFVQGTPAVVLDYSGFNEDNYESKLKDLMETRFSLPELYYDKSYAEVFPEEETFFEHFKRVLAGEYNDRIAAGVQKEQLYFECFIEEIKQEVQRKQDKH